MRIVRLGPSFVRLAIFTWCAAWASPLYAQEASGPTPLITPAPLHITAAALREAAADAVIDSPQDRSLLPSSPEKPRRPAVLMPLYGSLIALQGMDFHSTRRALGDAGSGREANPAMRPVVNNGVAFLAVKAGATAGVIWASEKMWKKNRKGAVIFATVVNAAMAVVVAHNYRISR